MSKFKVIFFAILIAFTLSESASAVVKINPKSPDFTLTLGGNIGDQVTSGLLFENSLILAATIDNPTTNSASAYVYSYLLDGTKQWELQIPNESVSGPLTKDSAGNIYILGATSTQQQIVNTTNPDPTVLNPDNIQTEPTFTPVNSLTNLTIWKISISGQLLQSFTLPVNEVVRPQSIAATASGFNIGANTATKYFQVTMSLDGSFGTIKYVKTPANPISIQEFKSGTNKLRFYIATKPIPGISSWRPKKPTPVLVQYSRLGQIRAANYFSGKVLFVLFQSNSGIYVVSESNSGFGVSIVKPLK